MLLHLFDNEKVASQFIESFEEVFPGGNIYVCFVNNLPQMVRPHTNLYFYKNNDYFDSSILKDVTKVIIHYLNYNKILFIQKYISESIPCTWMIWGGDLYNTFLVHRGYSLYYEPWYLGRTYLTILKHKLFHKLGIRILEETILLNFIKNRIVYFSTDADYEIMQKYIGEYTNGIQVTGFRYYPIETILGELQNVKAKGNLIWIGNSASFTNNHSYAFKYLSKLNIGKKKVITPLSYGGSKKYRIHIENKGNKIWGNSYESIKTFMPLKEYNKLMSSAEICIFSSWRQEAFGNIVVALYLGAKVFLSQKSSLVNYFQRLGIKIYILEKMTQIDIDTVLSEEIKESNRKILYDLLNKQNILDSIKRIWG